MIAARQIAFGKAGAKGLSAKDYIQDGLVAMWDGIENAGWGVHDSNAIVWKDLEGNCDLVLTNQGSFTGNALDMLGEGYAATASFDDAASVRSISICHGEMSGEGRWIEVHSQNIGFYTQYGNSNAYVSATTQPKCAKITTSQGTVSIVFRDDFSSEVYNGVDVASRSNGTTTTLASVKNQITLGGRYTPNTAVGLKAKFFSVRLYNRALTAEEIAYNYKIDKARFGL